MKKETTIVVDEIVNGLDIIKSEIERINDIIADNIIITDSSVSLIELVHRVTCFLMLSNITDCCIEINNCSNSYTTTISTKTGTSIIIKSTWNRAKTRVHVVVTNQIIVEERIHFCINAADSSYELYSVFIDDGTDEDIISNDGVLSKFFNNSLKNGKLEKIIKKMI